MFVKQIATSTSTDDVITTKTTDCQDTSGLINIDLSGGGALQTANVVMAGILPHDNNIISRDYSQSPNRLITTEDSNGTGWVDARFARSRISDTTQSWENSTGITQELEVDGTGAAALFIGNTNNRPTIFDQTKWTMASCYMKPNPDDDVSTALSGVVFGIQETTSPNTFYRIDVDWDLGFDQDPILVTKDAAVASQGTYGYENVGGGWWRIWVAVSGDLTAYGTSDGDACNFYLATGTTSNPFSDPTYGVGDKIQIAGLQVQSNDLSQTTPGDFYPVWNQDQYNFDVMHGIFDEDPIADTLQAYQLANVYPQMQIKIDNATVNADQVRVWLGHN